MDLSWKDEYDIGIDIIDSQHRGLFDILIRIRQNIKESDKKQAVILDVLDDLICYGKEHFRCEEDEMRKLGFSELELHIEIHKNFFIDVAQYQKKYLKGEITLTEILVFSVNWFKNHILHEDYKLKKYLKNIT